MSNITHSNIQFVGFHAQFTMKQSCSPILQVNMATELNAKGGLFSMQVH